MLFSMTNWSKLTKAGSAEELISSRDDCCFTIKPHSAFRSRKDPLYFGVSNEVESIEREVKVRSVEQCKTRKAASYVSLVVDGIVFPNTHIVCTRDRKILSDSFRALGHLLSSGFRDVGEATFERDLEDIEYVDRTAVVLGISTNTNYFHWLLEAIPRLLLASSHGLLPNDAVVIAPKMNRWMQEILAAYGLDELDYVNLSDKPHRFSRVIVPARGIENIRTFAHHSRLTSAIAGKAHSNEKARKLFISRAKSSSRKISNENEILSAASKFGYELIYPEDYTFIQQVDIFSHATHVCGCLGAGLTNLIFSNQKPHLLEFAPEGRTGDATLFSNMMDVWGGEYAGVVGAFNGNMDRKFDRRDIYIPLHMAEEAFDAIQC